MKITQTQLINTLKTQKSFTLDHLLTLFSLSITNENRLYLSSIIQKCNYIQLTYDIAFGHAIRVYSLKK